MWCCKIRCQPAGTSWPLSYTFRMLLCCVVLVMVLLVRGHGAAVLPAPGTQLIHNNLIESDVARETVDVQLDGSEVNSTWEEEPSWEEMEEEPPPEDLEVEPPWGEVEPSWEEVEPSWEEVEPPWEEVEPSWEEVEDETPPEDLEVEPSPEDLEEEPPWEEVEEEPPPESLEVEPSPEDLEEEPSPEDLEVEPSWEDLEEEPSPEDLEEEPLPEDLEEEPSPEDLEEEPSPEDLEEEPLPEDLEEEPSWEEVEVESPLEELNMETEELKVGLPKKISKRVTFPKTRRWPNATVPYVIQGSRTVVTRVMATFRQIEQDTCINFTPRSNHTSYLLIRQGWRGCWASSLGYPGPNRKVTVQLGRGCVYTSIIQHEILHALGYPHEHSRPDRDNHITVNWENIKPGRGGQFDKNMRYPTVEEVPYDFYSVMHYGKRAFSKNRQPTLEPNVELDGSLGGRRMSKLDKLKVNIFYECPTDSAAVAG